MNLDEMLKDNSNTLDFIDVLLDSDIYVIGSENVRSGELSLYSVNVKNEKMVVPVFTNLDELKSYNEEKLDYLKMNCRKLFKTIKHSYVYLNPKSEYGKSYSPEQLKAFMDYYDMKVHDTVLEQGTELIVRKSEKCSAKMLEQLTAFFSKHDNIAKAYVFDMVNPKKDDKAHLLLILDFKQEDTTVYQDILTIVQKFIAKDDYMNIMSTEQKAAQKFIANQQPFYIQ